MQNEARAHHDTPLLLTITRAAEFLKVSPDTLRRWEKKGIVTPLRTEGGCRRYTLLDLKIAKLNKRKTSSDINHRPPAIAWLRALRAGRDFKIALFTSFLWISGILIFNFFTPVFLRPTNPDQQISLDNLKKQDPLKIGAIRISLLSDSAPEPVLPTTGPDTLIHQSDNLPTLQYAENLNQYYSLTNPNNNNLTL